MSVLALLTESLQRAIISRLSADTVLAAETNGIVEYVPSATAFPYLVVQVNAWNNRSVVGRALSECVLTVHVWSDYKGNAEILTLMQRVEELLSAPSLILSDGQLMALTLRKSEILPEAASRLRRGQMDYRALLHE